jgi:predicted metal-dependent HD superfamily phosphohydrolase
MLKEIFLQLANKYSNDQKLKDELWKEIEAQYTNKSRHYHSLQHLENLLEQLNSVKAELKNYDVILFSLYYHDVIYNPLKSDNEEKSADLAEKCMKRLFVSDILIQACKAQILATKSHQFSSDSDTNYFTDADLSILGQSSENYSAYFKNVRKEYAIYPDLVYKPGRKKVLLHFLEMDKIYKTDFFFGKFEEPARQNLRKELELL